MIGLLWSNENKLASPKLPTLILFIFESKVIAHESGVNTPMAESLARLGEKVRNLKDHGLQEGASTRLLIYAGKLIKHGIPPRRACQSAVVWGVTDDQEVQKSITEVIMSIFE